MGNKIAAISLAVAVISAVITYLSLAHDSGIWPYSGPTWIWIGIGALLGVSGFLWIVILKLRNTALTLWTLCGSFAIAVAGAVLATAVAGKTAIRAGPASITIDSVHDGQLLENPITLAGRITAPLAPGESLWLFVGVLPPHGGKPGTYYLQPGPCAVIDDGRAWQCTGIQLGSNGRRDIAFSVLGARGDQPKTFTQYLMSGVQLDERNGMIAKYKLGSPVPGTDPRDSPTLPGGDGVRQLAAVTATLTR